MNVKLVAITKPLVQTDDAEKRFLEAEEFIVYCARVSNPDNQLNIKTAPKLINYCIKNKHWSIFEQVDLTFEIETSLAIATQLLRHRSAVFQMFSLRYSESMGYEDIEWRKQGQTNRQVGDEAITLPNSLQADINYHLKKANDLYKKLISKSMAKECARFILPTCTTTKLYMKNNVRNWIHYLEVRDTEHTQKEHRLIAQKIKKIFIIHFPNISKALEWTK